MDCRTYLNPIAHDSRPRHGGPADGLSYATCWSDDPSRMLDKRYLRSQLFPQES